MPGLAEFLKGTVNESLTKLLQPAGVVPAALLVLWNLGFVLPRAKREDLGIAHAYYALDEPWQVVVTSVLMLLLGYLLLSASGAVLDTLSGRTWRTSLLGSVFSRIRGARRAELARRVAAIDAVDDSQGVDIERIDSLRWRLRTRFAPGDDPPAPTAMGDVLLASEHGIRARYGVSAAALWEPLRAVVEKDDPAVAAAAEAKTTLDVMGNLTFAAVLILVEGVVVFTMFDDPDALLLSLAAAPFAYVAYRVTTAKGISWCDAVDTVVALHATKLFEKLGVPEPKDGAKRRERLGDLSDFMLRDAADDALFGASASPEPAVTASPNIKVELHEREERSPPGGVAGPTQRDSIRYLAFVTRTSSNAAPWTTDGRFVFADERLPRIRLEPPAASLIPAAEADQDDALLWAVQVTGGEVESLDFALDRWYVAVDAGCTVTVEAYTVTMRFVEVHNPGPNQVEPTVTIFHTEDGVTHDLIFSNDELDVGTAGRSRTVKFGALPGQGVRRFTYSLEELPE